MSSGWRQQFANPAGVGGWAVGHLMALKNRERSQWVLALLDLAPGESVLELGFGPGVDVQRAVRGGALVAGVDHSPEMLRQARRRNAHAIASGQVDLRLGSADSLPFTDRSFDKAFAINVAQFWPAAERPLAELSRVLRPGGLVALAVQPRARDATEETARETGAQLQRALEAAGFDRVHVESARMRPVSVVCALGRKGGA
jgi:ubiquinone/menaquinone biosynthesis C-methylase UbiE